MERLVYHGYAVKVSSLLSSSPSPPSGAQQILHQRPTAFGFLVERSEVGSLFYGD